MGDRKTEQSMSVVGVRMLKCVSRMTKEDRVRNEYVRDSNGLASIVDKVREIDRWFGHVMKKKETKAET